MVDTDDKKQELKKPPGSVQNGKESGNGEDGHHHLPPIRPPKSSARHPGNTDINVVEMPAVFLTSDTGVQSELDKNSRQLGDSTVGEIQVLTGQPD